MINQQGELGQWNGKTVGFSVLQAGYPKEKTGFPGCLNQNCQSPPPKKNTAIFLLKSKINFKLQHNQPDPSLTKTSKNIPSLNFF
jgi:hypothetical protein